MDGREVKVLMYKQTAAARTCRIKLQLKIIIGVEAAGRTPGEGDDLFDAIRDNRRRFILRTSVK